MKKTLALICTLFLCISISGCKKQEPLPVLDATGYIKSLMDSTYQNSNTDYISFSNATDEEAAQNNQICAENATVRFFEKYKLNPDVDQQKEMSEVFKTAYSLCTYKVGKMMQTKTGYNISVEFTPLTNFLSLEEKIGELELNSGLERYDVGAEFIEDVIALARQSLDNPTFDHQTTKTIDVKVEDQRKYYLNIKLLQTIDIEIMPV